MINIWLYSLISFLIVLSLIPWVIKYLRKIGLMDQDQNKKDKSLIPISGGIPVLVGIFAGLMLFIFIQTFIYNETEFLLKLFASMTSIMIITFIGFSDDLLRITKKNGTDKIKGLKQWQKPILTLAAAIPLMVVNAGTTTLALPFIGRIDVGLIYPLIFIPIGVIGSANMVNMLAGYNGLEASLGIVYLTMLGLFALTFSRLEGALLAFLTVAALLAFLIYNKFPAKILSGDSLTYLLGGVLVNVAIIGNIERAAIIVSIPFFIEFFLKLRTNFKAKSYGYYKNGKIQSYYNKIYSIPHIFTIKGKYTEKQIVLFIVLIELFFASFIWLRLI